MPKKKKKDKYLGDCMFEHQVIEDVGFDIIGKEVACYDEISGSFKITIPNIKDCHCFHVGEYLSMCQLCGYKLNTITQLEDIKYLKMPYKKIWVDCFNHNENFKNHEILDNSYCDKYATLAIEYLDNMWVLFSFFHFKTHDIWQICPLLFKLIITENKWGTHPSWMTIPGYREYSKELMDNINRQSAGDAIHVLLILLKLLNCKNIQSEKIKAPEALNKKRRKAGKQEIFDYHVLNVVVPSKRQEHHESTVPLSHNRIHLCRGHFKEYTKEHPLFGQYTGLYWWQPHVRGQNKDGIIVKDYNVKAL